MGRIRRRSSQPPRDVALFSMLFAMGLRPLEIARLRVADCLEADGSVRKQSVLPADASITGRPRALYFASARLTEAMDECLAERLSMSVSDGEGYPYRGLRPDASLFVGADEEVFRITRHGEPGRWRYLCRPILETFRKIFRMAEVDGVTPVSVRRTIVMRLHVRGADEAQIAEMLGISDRSCVRELLDLNRPSLEELAEQLL